MTTAAAVTALAIPMVALVAPADAHNGKDHKASTHTARAHVGLSTSAKRVDPGGSAVLTTKVTVSGAVAGGTVDVYAKAKVRGAKVWCTKGSAFGRHGAKHWKKLYLTRWVKVGTITTDPATGIGTLTVTPTKSTAYKVVLPKTDTHRKAISRTVVVKVKKAPVAPTPTP